MTSYSYTGLFPCRMLILPLCMIVVLARGFAAPDVFVSMAIAHEKPGADKPATASAEPLSKFEETWQVIYIGKSRVGFGRSSVTRKTIDGEELVLTDTELALVISRLGQTIKLKMINKTEESPDGDLHEFAFELKAPPAESLRTRGKVEGGTLTVITETNGKPRTKTQPWDSSVKSPALQERLLRDAPLMPGESRSFKAYLPELGAASTFKLQAGDYEQVKLLDGKTAKLLRVTVTQSIDPNNTTLDYVDALGVSQKTTMNLAGLSVSIYKVSQQEALKALTGEEVDLAVATFIKVAAIENSQKTRRVIYRITTPGEDPEKILSRGLTQRIARVDAHTADLTVEAITPPEKSPDSSDKESAKEFTASSSFIQSDDELVQKHARDAVGAETDPWKSAQLMERWVNTSIKQKNFSTLLASAAEVARTLSGDCTEHAVLLAAMCRSRGIPSRVAVGLVYVPSLSSFGGHMWTEVFVRGIWIPLDATLGKGGIAADHIKFADSSFSDDGESAPLTSFLPMASVLGKMKIEVRDVQHKK